jgi:hypothetical protein
MRFEIISDWNKARARISALRGKFKSSVFRNAFKLKPYKCDFLILSDGDRLLGGYLHLFGHTLHDGGPINVRDQGLCLDCAEAFILPGKDYPTMEK